LRISPLGIGDSDCYKLYALSQRRYVFIGRHLKKFKQARKDIVRHEYCVEQPVIKFSAANVRYNAGKPIFIYTLNTLMEQIVEEAPTQIQYPLLGDRVQSTFIDVVFMVILMFIASSILDSYDNVPDWLRISLFLGIWLVYDPLCTTLGFTLGNYIKGLRVRQYSDPTRRINIFQAVIRYVIKLFLGWISFLTIHSNTERRAIHDMVVGSVVIKK
jgi:uncharacterized RDD family membrane protein YckC